MSNPNTSPRHVLVYGATGSQSSPVVRHLLDNGHLPHALTRHPQKAESLRQAGAKIVEGDMANRERLVELSRDVDAVSLQIPFGLDDPMSAPQMAQNAIDAAKEVGVDLIVWNTSGPLPPKFIGDPAMDLRVMIAGMLQNSGVPHIILAPTGYMENFLGPWTAPFVANEDRLAYPNPEHMCVGWIASDDVGKLMASALERPELAGERFNVSGLENVDGPELAEHFSAALDREITYYAMEPEEFGAILNQIMPGMGDGAAEIYRKMRDNPNPPAMWHDMQPVLDKLPVEMTSIEQWVKQHRAAFEPA